MSPLSYGEAARDGERCVHLGVFLSPCSDDLLPPMIERAYAAEHAVEAIELLLALNLPPGSLRREP